MKHLILGLLVFSNFAWADEDIRITIANANDANARIEVACVDANCQNLEVRDFRSGQLQKSDRLTITELNDCAEQHLERLISTNRPEDPREPYTPYKFTSEALSTAKDNAARGYVGEAILGYLLSIPLAAYETVALPAAPVSYLTATRSSRSIEEKKGARRLVRIFNSGELSVSIKEKQFKQVSAVFHCGKF